MTTNLKNPSQSRNTVDFRKASPSFLKRFSNEVLLTYATGLRNTRNGKFKIIYNLIHDDDLIKKLAHKYYKDIEIGKVEIPLEYFCGLSNFTLYKNRQFNSHSEDINDVIQRKIFTLDTLQIPSYINSTCTTVQNILKDDLRYQNIDFPVIQYKMENTSLQTGVDSIIFPTLEIVRKFLLVDDYFLCLLNGRFQNGEIIDFNKLAAYKNENYNPEVGNVYFKTNYEYTSNSNDVTRILGLLCYDEIALLQANNLRKSIEKSSYTSALKNKTTIPLPSLTVPCSSGFIAQVSGRIITTNNERHYLVNRILNLKIDYPCSSFTPILPDTLVKPERNKQKNGNNIPKPKRNIKEKNKDDIEFNDELKAPLDDDPIRIITDNIFQELPPINPPSTGRKEQLNQNGNYKTKDPNASVLTNEGTTGEGDENAKKATFKSNSSNLKSDDSEIEIILSCLTSLKQSDSLIFESVILEGRKYNTRNSIITTYVKDPTDLWSNVNEGRPILIAQICLDSIITEANNHYVYLLRPTKYANEHHRSVIIARKDFKKMRSNELEMILRMSSKFNANWSSAFKDEELDLSSKYKWNQHNKPFLAENKFKLFLENSVKSLWY